MKQSRLATLGHKLSVRRARIEEEKYDRAEAARFKHVALESEALNQRLQAEMADAEFFESLRRPETTPVFEVKKAKLGFGVRLVQLFTSLF